MDLFAKARNAEIQTEFIDGQGHRHVTDAAALRIILDALPVQAPRRLVGGAVVVRAGQPSQTELEQAATFPVRWKIVAGLKVITQGETGHRTIVWPADLPIGSYRLHLTDAASFTEETPLTVAPPRAFGGDFDRCWLVAVQLYGVRSARNWGIGDFTDLEGLIELAGHLGADGIGLNPLHALFDDRPGDCSPYSPNSRLFLNALYVDVEKLPAFRPDAFGESAGAIAGLRQADLVDYVGVAALKWRALRCAFERFRTRQRRNAGRICEIRAEREPLLSRFACFEVLRHRFNKPWWEWPKPWRQPDEANGAKLRQGPDAAEIEFVEFVQWTADRQLRSCRDLAARLGMKVGLVRRGRRRAIRRLRRPGTSRPQFPVLSLSARHRSPLNTSGENWGLAGFYAAGLEIQSFEPYREMLRASMRYAGAIRLDHVLGLKRVYLVPHGFAADNGAYVQMPFEALLAATAQESMAHRCVVIGEDLGTVPEVREQMADWGIWSYQVMMFERDDHGRFRGIHHYASNALVTFNTHDLSSHAAGAPSAIETQTVARDRSSAKAMMRHELRREC